MLNRTLIAAAFLAASLPAPSFAHDRDHDDDGEDGFTSHAIDETRPLKADGALFVSNVAGTIEVQAWDKNEVHITGELGEGTQKLDISGDASSLHVEVQVPRSSHDVEDTTLRLRVPAGARLEIEAVSADVAVQGMRGELHVQGVSGDVGVDVQSARIEAQTVSGSLTVRAPSRSAKISTVSGDIRLSGAREQVQAESVSGDMDIDAEGISDMRLKSVSGELDVEATLAATPRVQVESLSGEIRLQVPKEPDAQVVLHSFSGELGSDFGPAVGERKKRYEATLGSGKGRVELTSFSGDIRLEKLRR